MTDGDGIIYDIVLRKPTDVEYDPHSPSTYRKLQESMDQILSSLKGVGQAEYVSGAGMKGEELYQDVLQKYVTAMEEKWNAVRLEKEGMSPAYEMMLKIPDGSILDRVGYAYRDLTGEGIEELLIGEIPDADERPMIYDIYGIEDHSPAHLLSGWKENRYYLGEHNLYNEFTGPGGEEYRIILDNDFTLQKKRLTDVSSGIRRFKIDRNKNEAQPWFIYKISENGVWDWVNVTEAEYEEKMSRYVKENELEFKPLSGLSFGEQ